MSAAAPIPFETEATSLGPQTLVPGVRPVSMKARLEALAAHPMCSNRVQKPCDLGLFDEVARNQLDMFSTTTPTQRTET
jgi:hypothetical protein